MLLGKISNNLHKIFKYCSVRIFSEKLMLASTNISFSTSSNSSSGDYNSNPNVSVTLSFNF